MLRNSLITDVFKLGFHNWSPYPFYDNTNLQLKNKLTSKRHMPSNYKYSQNQYCPMVIHSKRHQTYLINQLQIQNLKYRTIQKVKSKSIIIVKILAGKLMRLGYEITHNKNEAYKLCCLFSYGNWKLITVGNNKKWLSRQRNHEAVKHKLTIKFCNFILVIRLITST